MRLWHQSLLSFLPRQQLLGQHRECCALRGKGWGKKHAIVDYVFTHDPAFLVAYHMLVMREMERRGYHPDPIWKNPYWRGNTLGEVDLWADADGVDDLAGCAVCCGETVFPEHNEEYLRECIENLESKNIDMSAAKEILL